MASSYGHIKKGASGDTVKWLQQQLGIEADGVFGSQTEQAVRDFQRASGIQVDGIVGNETMEYLIRNGAPNTTPNNQTTNFLADYAGNRPSYSQSQAVIDAANILSQYEGSKPGPYQQSQALKDAADILAQYEGNKPAEYQSSYADQIQGMLDQIMNREKFSYDFATDPMYRQYAEKYQQQGQLAMMDTMGQAAALTGGYGNTYAQNVGQQAYQAHLQELNDIIPELRNAAYQVYQDEGQQLYNQMGVLQGLENTEYGRYRDTVSDYYSDLNYYYNKYNDMSADEYNRYLNDLSAWERDRDYYYGKYNDLSDDDYNRYLNDLAAWQDDRNFAYQQQQDAQAQANWEAEFAFTKEQAAKSGSSSSSRGSSGSSSRSSGSSGSGTEAYADVKAYLDDQYRSGASADELQVLLYGVDNISDDDFEKLQTYIDLLGMTGGSNTAPMQSNSGGSKSAIPTSYNAFVDATGFAGIMTETEFASRKSAGAASLAEYKSYRDYLADRYERYK